MHLHSQLLLPFTGALVGLPLIVFLSWLLFRIWPRLSKPQRLSFLLPLSLFGSAYCLAVYAWFVEPNFLVVHRETIVSEQWHGPPLTIAAISDMHVRSPHVSMRRVGHIVARINALHPDLVVLLGDYGNTHQLAAERSAASRSEILNGIAAFAALDARYGVVAVLGNHDSSYGRTSLAEALESAGAAAMWNRHVVIARPSGRFAVAGLADSSAGHPDFALAIDGAPADADIIVLTHDPDLFADVPGDVALTLAGHTHCGQVTIPFIGRPRVHSNYGQKYACHLIEDHGRKLFVTSGIGTSAMPVRFLNPPEIALITLKAANRER